MGTFFLVKSFRVNKNFNFDTAINAIEKGCTSKDFIESSQFKVKNKKINEDGSQTIILKGKSNSCVYEAKLDLKIVDNTFSINIKGTVSASNWVIFWLLLCWMPIGWIGVGWITGGFLFNKSGPKKTLENIIEWMETQYKANESEKISTHITQQIGSVAEEIKKLGELLSNGLLTKEEFNRQKESLLVNQHA